jgi:hypothetical protein
MIYWRHFKALKVIGCRYFGLSNWALIFWLGNSFGYFLKNWVIFFSNLLVTLLQTLTKASNVGVAKSLNSSRIQIFGFEPKCWMSSSLFFHLRDRQNIFFFTRGPRFRQEAPPRGGKMESHATTAATTALSVCNHRTDGWFKRTLIPKVSDCWQD